MSGPHRGVASYDATDLNTITGTAMRLTFWLRRGLDDAPNVRGRDTVLPGTAGRTARNRVRDRRVIEIEGFVAGVGSTSTAQTTDFRDAMETLRTLFDVTRSPAVLIIDLEDGSRTATITARPRNVLPPRYEGDVAATINIELEAVGADWVIA